MRNIVPCLNCMMIAAALGLMLGIASPAAAGPLKAFILAGQSNLQGHVNKAGAVVFRVGAGRHLSDAARHK